jgi:hypothetical protein
VNEFVEECRREWRRLGVQDPVADEMATELAADLAEAEAEGVSAEQVLGSGAFDPRAFATAWAAERGVIRRRVPPGQRLPRRSRVLAAITAFALVAIAGAVLVTLASPSTPQRVAVPSSVGLWMRVVPPPVATARASTVTTITPTEVRPVPPTGTRIVAVDINDSGVNARAVGLVLLIVGLAGLVPLTLFWLWIGPGSWPRRQAHVDA